MPGKKRRSQNFTSNEKMKLVKLLATHTNVILNKKNDGATNNAKKEAWMNVCNRFNSSGNAYRSRESLIRLWEKMKSEAKVYESTNTVNRNGTGGPSTIKTDLILDQVCILMGQGCIADVHDSHVPDLLAFPCNADSNHNCNDTVINILPEEDFQVSIEENEEIKRSLIEDEIYENINIKKCEIEELKKELLQNEITFKKQLYDLQLETARTDLEIKIEVLKQLKGGAINVKDLIPRIN